MAWCPPGGSRPTLRPGAGGTECGPSAPPSCGAAGCQRAPTWRVVVPVAVVVQTMRATPPAVASTYGSSPVPAALATAGRPSKPVRAERRSANAWAPSAMTACWNPNHAATGLAMNAAASMTGHPPAVHEGGVLSPSSWPTAGPAEPRDEISPPRTDARASPPTSARASGEVRSSTSWRAVDPGGPNTTRSAASTNTTRRCASRATPARRSPTCTMTPSSVTSRIVAGPVAAPYRAWACTLGRATTVGWAPMLASNRVAASSRDTPPPAAALSPAAGAKRRPPVSSVSTNRSRVRSIPAARVRVACRGSGPDTVAPTSPARCPNQADSAASDAPSCPSQSRRAATPRVARSARGRGTTESGPSPNRPRRVVAGPERSPATACSSLSRRALSVATSWGPISAAESSVRSRGVAAPGTRRPVTDTARSPTAPGPVGRVAVRVTDCRSADPTSTSATSCAMASGELDPGRKTAGPDAGRVASARCRRPRAVGLVVVAARTPTPTVTPSAPSAVTR